MSYRLSDQHDIAVGITSRPGIGAHAHFTGFALEWGTPLLSPPLTFVAIASTCNAFEREHDRRIDLG
jgi:hypothetical protein